MAGTGQVMFDRRCRLTISNPSDIPGDFKNVQVETIEIDGGMRDDRSQVGLRVKFNIQKTLKKEPNNSEITIFNLADNTRAKLQKKGVRVVLEAGYKGTGVSRYFSGDLRTVDHIRDKAEWQSVLKLGDGERAWQYAQVNESFAPGTRVTDALKKLGRACGIGVGNLDKQADSVDTVLDQGFAAVGSATRAFDQLVRSVRKEWSVQDGELQLLDPDGVLDLPVPEISPSSGLIGSPEMGSPQKKGKPALVKFKSLLIPVKPGGKVRLRSKRYDGFVKVQACSFTGDTSGGEWYTEIAGVITEL